MHWLENDWSDRAAVCIGGGPSLTRGQILTVREAREAGRCRVIAVNDAYRVAPWADVVYAGDTLWWKVHHKSVSDIATGQLWTCDNVAAARYGINRVRALDRPGLGHYHIHTGHNSGFQALNLAFLWRARTIILVGYDMQATGGMRHWFGDHPRPLVQEQCFGRWIRYFDDAARELDRLGVRVFNCSNETALRCFERVDLEEAIWRR